MHGSWLCMLERVWTAEGQTLPTRTQVGGFRHKQLSGHLLSLSKARYPVMQKYEFIKLRHDT